MFIPVRKDGLLFKAGKANAYGEREYAQTGEKFGWGAIHTRSNLGATAVRADSSASKARSEHLAADFRITVEKWVKPELGDKLTLGSEAPVEVTRVQRRDDINGRLHHWEVDCATL